jgi:hypothetical protein
MYTKLAFMWGDDPSRPNRKFNLEVPAGPSPHSGNSDRNAENMPR